LLLAFELIYFLVVKAKIKELFTALKAVAIKAKKYPFPACVLREIYATTNLKYFFAFIAELSKPPTTPTTTPKDKEKKAENHLKPLMQR